MSVETIDRAPSAAATAATGTLSTDEPIGTRAGPLKRLMRDKVAFLSAVLLATFVIAAILEVAPVVRTAGRRS